MFHNIYMFHVGGNSFFLGQKPSMSQSLAIVQAVQFSPDCNHCVVALAISTGLEEEKPK